ncbi:MAG: Arc family DNA-binding protein [Candidatus Contendobacter sp.]|nr:Arc family DNA-binding protein [Candidatus Contendobacter sp.]
MDNYALRVPESLFAYARKVAEEEHVSMNQFFVIAIAEKSPRSKPKLISANGASERI